jgi:superfamily I DNA and/or RNA helicase
MISYLEESLLMNDSQYSQLDVQYRMRDSIGAMVSTLFYSGGLKSINHTKDEIRLGLLMGAVDWLDTGAVGLNKGMEHRVGDSYSNRFEIDVIKDRLTILTNALGRIINPSRKLTVLVIAPYAAQVELARSNLNQFNSNFLDIQFNSIDAVQGREADIVFFTTVRNNQNGRTGFLSRSNWRRINVALSRARLNLTIVGNLGFWESSDSSLSDVIGYLKTESMNNSEYRIDDARSS